MPIFLFYILLLSFVSNYVVSIEGLASQDTLGLPVQAGSSQTASDVVNTQ